MICSECGLVVGDRVIDVGCEWRNFSDDNRNYDPSRVGAAENHLLNGSDLSTIIAYTAQSSATADGSRKYHNSNNVSSTDRVLINAYKEISNMADRINISQNVIDRANLFFKQAHDGNKLKSRSHAAIAAACLYIACRHERVPRTFKEICAVSNVSKYRIGRSFKFMMNEVLETSVDLIKTGDFMSRFCSNLQLPASVQRAATNIAAKAVELDIVPGKSPISVAAAAIYIASQASEDKKSRKEIVEVTGVAESTILDSYKLMYARIEELLPTDFKLHTSN
ncbi:transcription initiation factor IIB-like isoform X2 [Leptotrombidium deliense]|uniref:Transcription initiation factor IIB n=1 Tax=Leptotrombidium deliense TaxID=299467 RepID=A0A443RZY3_9ACAR|nr:transcription initiation factor IIB-like isoform X2 [Leptotrombidium deliense]